MQIIWRYLLGQYLKVFALCVVAFVLFLIVMRMKETAEFAALGAPLFQMLLFVLYQFPFILPIAIPVSSLISSILLMQRLSSSHEIIALRSAGFSFKQIIAPILAGALCLSFLNFFLISEVSTNSLLASKKMIQNLSSLNPLLLLQNTQFLKFKNVYVVVDPLETPLSAQNTMVFIKEKKNNRIAMFYVQNLEAGEGRIKGKNAGLVSTLGVEDDQAFDNLIIDSQEETSTPVTEFVQLLKDNRLRIPYDHLQLSLLLIQKAAIQEKIKLAKMREASSHSLQQWQILDNKCCYEVMRRVSLGMAPFTFSLLGAAFGIHLGRRQPKKNLLIVIGFAALSCTTFFLAKSSNQSLWIPAAMLYLPQLSMIAASVRHLGQCNKGVQ